MILLYTLLAVFIAWIWVDYYRLIDIYDKENLKYFIFTFLLGALSTLIVFGIEYYGLARFHFSLNGDVLNDLLYCVFNIGLIEEFSKTVPFIIMFYAFKSQINEPVDYLVFISISALGFSAAENALYFHSYGPTVINGRAILAPVSHMFNSSLIAYGIIRLKYGNQNSKVLELILYSAAAIVSHGFYDFWLLHQHTRSFGWFISVSYFMVTVSIFAVILNNALNNSSFFTYKKVINSDKVVQRLLIYYGIVFCVQFALLTYQQDAKAALGNLRGSLYVSGLIIAITVLRLSRFKLIKDRWHPVRFESPVTVVSGEGMISKGPRYRLQVKGESFNETFINAYYEEYFHLCPLSPRKSYLQTNRLGFIARKIFLQNDEAYYIAKVFNTDQSSDFELFLLKPKTSRITMFSEKKPVVALFSLQCEIDLENPRISEKDLRFREWVVIHPKQPLKE